MIMAKNKVKYDPDLHPILAAGMAKDGMSNTKMAEKIGINKRTFYKWMKEYVEFRAGVVVSKAIADYRMEDSVYRRGIGYKYTEITYEKVGTKKELIDNEEIMTDLYKKKIVVKEIAGDVGAQKFWLTNRKPEVWKIDPEKQKEADTGQLEAIRNMLQNGLVGKRITN